MGKLNNHSGDLVGTTLEGKYQILRRLGEGGMGVVYEALHTGISRRCAVKVLSPDVIRDEELIARFEREVRITGSLGHPNIIQVTDTGKTPDGAPYLVMELLHGKSLGDVLDQDGPLAPEKAIEYILPVLDALVVVHHEGVIHRDLKPDNIFLAEMGRPGRTQTVVKVLDFGIAKPIKQGLIDRTLTNPYTTIGTPHYMPLEQACGKEIDHRADIYAVGVILYEMLTRKLPFNGDTLVELVVALQTSDPLPPSFHRAELSLKLDAVILKALSRSQDRRYSDAEEFLKALEPFAHKELLSSLHTTRKNRGADIAPSASEPPAPLPRKNWWRRWFMLVGASTITVAGLVVLSLYVFRSPTSEPDSGPVPPDALCGTDADAEGTDTFEDSDASQDADSAEGDGPTKAQDVGIPPVDSGSRRPRPADAKRPSSSDGRRAPNSDAAPNTVSPPPVDEPPRPGPLPIDPILPGFVPLSPDIEHPAPKRTP
jgi:serine/threonine protein kinase